MAQRWAGRCLQHVAARSGAHRCTPGMRRRSGAHPFADLLVSADSYVARRPKDSFIGTA